MFLTSMFFRHTSSLGRTCRYTFSPATFAWQVFVSMFSIFTTLTLTYPCLKAQLFRLCTFLPRPVTRKERDWYLILYLKQHIALFHLRTEGTSNFLFINIRIYVLPKRAKTGVRQFYNRCDGRKMWWNERRREASASNNDTISYPLPGL